MTTTAQAGQALVTGAGQRVGAAIARDLAARGWDIAVHYNAGEEGARSVVRDAQAAGVNAVALQADLSEVAAATALTGRAIEALGGLTCLVNNASIFEMDTIEDLDAGLWDRHLDVNLRAPALLTQAFAAALPKDTHGNVINLLDQRVWRLTPHFLSYTVSKTGLWTLTRTLAMALAPWIRVNAIGPGPALPSARQTEAQFDRQRRSTLLNRGTTPEEICAAVRFILEAPALTGQMIVLDGGQHLAWRALGPDAMPE